VEPPIHANPALRRHLAPLGKISEATLWRLAQRCQGVEPEEAYRQEARRRKQRRAQRRREALPPAQLLQNFDFEAFIAREHGEDPPARDQAEKYSAAAAAAAAAAIEEERQRVAEEERRREEVAAAAAAALAQEQEAAALQIQAVGRGLLARQIHVRRLNSPVSVICVLGGPGTGKTSLCTQLTSLCKSATKQASASHLLHISSGELLRNAVRAQVRIA